MKVSNYVGKKKLKLQNACYSSHKDAWKTSKSWQMTYIFMKH